MYNVYIKNFKRSDSIVTTEEEMFSIPSSNTFPVLKPVVKTSEDAADNYSFTMESNSPYYDALLPLKTIIRVVYDGDIIFYGRVLNVSASTVFQTKSVTCEGWYAFMNDTFYEGVQEKFRQDITLEQYYTNILNNHNSNDPSKEIRKGNLIGMTLPTELKKYEPTAWTDTVSLIGNLTSNYGGHMRIRYNGLIPYMDWYKYYFRDLGDGQRPAVTVGKNILDIFSQQSIDNIFTYVIPIGGADKNGKQIYIDGYKWSGNQTYSGKAMPVAFIRNLYTDLELTDEFHSYKDYRDAEANYGIIYKTMSFGDANTQEKLWNNTKKWIKECYFGLADSFTVKAIDFHIQDQSIPKILVGECVDVTYIIVRNGIPVWETKKLVCKSVQYDLFNPENNSYTFGIPTDMLGYDQNGKNYSQQSAKTASSSGGRKPINSGGEDDELTRLKIYEIIGGQVGDHIYTGTEPADSFYWDNEELSGTVYCIDPDEITTGDIAELNAKKFEAQLVGKITLPGQTVKWVAVSTERGLFAYENTRHINIVRHWYLKYNESKSGTKYKYTPSSSGKSSIEDYAKLIEDDTNASWGGAAAAASFRANGRISGSVNKCYDPNVCTQQEARADPKLVFSAQIVGKFTLNNNEKYVAVSKEHGVFGFNASARGIIPATHWYNYVKGENYDNTSGVFTEENTGTVYTTSDGNPDSEKTIVMKTQTLTGEGSEGEVLIGYDLTAPGDKWKIKLNIPIQYTDKDGNVQIKDGFVSASDFNIEEIPSFKTKLGIFDVVIAGKVDAAEIEADLAYLRKLNSDVIIANTYVRSDHIRCNDIGAVSYLLNVPSEGGSGYDVAYLQNSFSSCLVWAGTGTGGNNNELGRIYFQFSKIGGGIGQTVNFKIADTRFYQDGVAAARNEGYDAYHSMFITGGSSNTQISSVTIPAGESRNFYPTFQKTDGTYQHGSLIRVTAEEGGGDDVTFVNSKCYATSISSPQATDDDGNLHQCIFVKDIGEILSTHKSIRIIFKVGSTEHYYYFAINR